MHVRTGLGLGIAKNRIDEMVEMLKGKKGGVKPQANSRQHRVEFLESGSRRTIVGSCGSVSDFHHDHVGRNLDQA